MKSNGQFTIALHLCIYMDYHADDLYSSKDLSESVRTNPVVIRRLVSKLRNADIVGSIPGAGGGFYLKRPASKITMWDVYIAVKETDLFYQPKSNPDCIVSRNLSNLLAEPFSASEQSLKRTMGSVKIRDLRNSLKKSKK